MLRWARAKASTLSTGGGPHGHQPTTFLYQPSRDPGRQYIGGPILRYAREAWENTDDQLMGPKTIPAKQFHSAMAHVLSRWKQGERTVRGPMSAMLKSLESLGWRMLSPYTIKNHKDEVMHLEVGSPAMLRKM
eukprot:804730-Karenia_brevis.AAC.1